MIIIKNKNIALLFLGIFFISTEMIGMTPDEQAYSIEKLNTMKSEPFFTGILTCSDNELLIYPTNEDPVHGTCWSTDIVLLSDTLKNSIGDLGGWENLQKKEIPIEHSSTAIKNARNILTEYASTQNEEEIKNKIEAIIKPYSFQQLNDTANCIEYLHYSPDINKILLESMKQKLLKSSTYLNGINFNLYPELKSYVMNPLINWIKNLFIAQNMQDKNNKKIISQKSEYHQALLALYLQDACKSNLFKHIAFDSDKKEIVFNQNSNLIVLNLEGIRQLHMELPVQIYASRDENRMDAGEIIPSSDCKYIAYTRDDNAICIQEIFSKKITQLSPNPANSKTNKLAFDNNNTKLGALCNKDIIVWDINQPEKPTLHFTIPDHFSGASITFSPEGTKIAACGSSLSTTSHTRMYTIYIFNTSDGNLVQTLETKSSGRAKKITFTPDGKRIIASGYTTIPRGKNLMYKYNLIIWNIENIKEASYNILDYTPSAQGAFVLNSNGTTMITGGSEKNKNTLELWNLSNYDNITHQTIAHLSGICNSLALDKDNTILISGDAYPGKFGYTNSLIRWDILSKENHATAENIKNYDLERIKLLYQLYLKRKCY